MYRIALSYTHQKEAALDVIQDSFQKALVNFHKLPVITDFRAWFYQILLRTAIDSWRKQKRQQINEQMSLPETGVTQSEFSQQELQIVLKQLKSPEYEIILLRFFEGFQLNEIAAILNLNPNTVKTKLYRALNELKDILEEES